MSLTRKHPRETILWAARNAHERQLFRYQDFRRLVEPPPSRPSPLSSLCSRNTRTFARWTHIDWTTFAINPNLNSTPSFATYASQDSSTLFQDACSKPRSAGLDHLEFLELLVQDELARRSDPLFDRRLKQAEIVQVKELSDFEWAFNPKVPRAELSELATARFIDEHRNVPLIDPPGVGKSHAAVAVAVGGIRRGYRALVRSAFDLTQDFAEAELTGAGPSSRNCEASTT